MFSTLLFYFILCRTKCYSGEEAANMIVDGLLSDEMMHLWIKAIYFLIYTLNLLIQTVQKQTRIFKMMLLLLLRMLKSEEPYEPEGGVRRQPTSRPVVQNVTQASDPQELQQQKPKHSAENNWICDPADPLHFNSLLNQVH